MTQKKLLKTSFLLIIFSFIAKMLSIIAKVMTTRLVGTTGMGYFSLASPIMILVITICQFGVPTTVARLIAANEKNKLKIILTSILIMLTINIIFIFIYFPSVPFIAKNILKNNNTIYPLYGIGILGPLVSISGLLKGYCIGVNKVITTSLSQISEELGRIIFLIIFMLTFSEKQSNILAFYAVIGMCIGEVFQIFHYLFANIKSLNKLNKKIKNIDYNFKQILAPSSSILLNRLSSSFTNFLEPIILTSIMLKIGFNNEVISYEYGLLCAYAIPLIFLPSFFSNVLSTILLPNMTRYYANKKIINCRKILLKVLIISLIIGLIYSVICYIYPSQLLNILYQDDSATKYLKAFAIPFTIYYIESPLSNTMIALNQEKKIFNIGIISSIFRIFSLIILTPKLNVYAIGISTFIHVLITVIAYTSIVIKLLFFNNK